MSGEKIGPLNAAYLIANGHRRKIDLNEYEAEYESKPLYSFLSMTWSFIADVDINSEVLRCLGTARLEVYGAYRLAFLKNYIGDFSYKGIRVGNRNDLIPEN